jgi:hypothetical protein
MANARITSWAATNEDVPDADALWPPKDNGSESDIVAKFLIGIRALTAEQSPSVRHRSVWALPEGPGLIPDLFAQEHSFGKAGRLRPSIPALCCYRPA